MSGVQILVVHGYEVYAGGRLGQLAEAVCQKVAEVAGRYTYILLVGGWHLPEAGAVTIAEAIKQRLLALGVPVEKLRTRQDLGLSEYLPPRDSIEEADLAGLMLARLGVRPETTAFDFAVVSYFANRVHRIYKARGARPRYPIVPPRESTRNWKRQLMQIPAAIITWWDPKAERPITGKIIARHRAARTLVSDTSKFKLLTPNAWQ